MIALNMSGIIQKSNKDFNNSLIMPLMIASTIMLISSCLVFYILIYRTRTNDLVGNLRIRKRTASFKVAFLSWILTGMETILRLIGLFDYTDHALPEHYVPWQAILCYHLLVLIQRTVQSESQLLIRLHCYYERIMSFH